MRKYIFLLVFFGCQNNKTRSLDNKDSIKNQEMAANKSDTTCYNKLENIKLKSLIFLEACYFSYDRNKSTQIAQLYGNGKLSPELNFDTGTKKLNITRNNDTIFVSILYMSNYRNFVVKPERIVESKDSILLSLRGNINPDSTNHFSNEFEFSEMKFKFRRLENTKSLIFLESE